MAVKSTNTIKIFEYGKSFIQTTNNSENTPRFLVDSKCTIINGDKVEEYYLGAKCKGENTFAKDKLFQELSFEFFPVFSNDKTLIFRRFKWYLPSELEEYKKLYNKGELWGNRKFVIKETEPSEVLNTQKEIKEATLAGKPIMGRIVIVHPVSGIKAILDFPIKTMNVNGKEWQVDTGPIIFPDLGLYPIQKILSFSLSFIAFNSFNFIEAIMESIVQINGTNPVVYIARDEGILRIKNPEIYLYSI